jgi:hypothetical protein
LHKICEDLLRKYKVNHKEAKQDLKYETPLYSKPSIDCFGSYATNESETQKFDSCLNREKVGQDLKNQWCEMMKEFEQGSKTHFLGSQPQSSLKL